ncbi:protein-disulfide reductase DsbD [Arvimicrobium flavum]|uniref:protein-disulfide reductase DsbD n=1 Tax=Arvimicrobium flavum TaxID=3393320 RepID=UPI00237A0A63|nr:protein-disulfide reductase DsbD [Mesorhizobium shangrilense]
MKAIVGFVSALLALMALSVASSAEPLAADDAFRMTAVRGGDGIELRWEIADGYYLYRDHFEVHAAEPVPFTSSRGEVKDDPSFGSVEVIYRQARVAIAGPVAQPLKVTYQGCQEDGICYRPETRQVDPATLAISDAGPTVAWSTPAQDAPPPVEAADSGLILAEDQGGAARLLADGAYPWVIAGFLGFGLLLAFTPCVLPMYPIVAGMLGRQGESLTAARGFTLASVYVVALAFAFALVGAIVAWSGHNMQIALQSPWTTAASAAILVLLALSMFGLFELQLPSAWTSRFAGRNAGRGSITSAAALGFSSALIVGPCVTAPLAGALIYVAQGGDWKLGAAALFALGLGKGLPLIALAGFGGHLLPRAGAWMESVKKAFGFAFLGVAIWLASPLLSDVVLSVLWALLLIAAAGWLLGRAAKGWRRRALRATAGVFSVYAAVMGLTAASGGDRPFQAQARIVLKSPPQSKSALAFEEVATLPDLLARFDDPDGQKRPLMVYFTADWCVICRKIERSVLPDPRIEEALASYRLVKVDITELDPRREELMKALRVAGPPSMVFFHGDKREIEGTRLIGTIDVDSLVTSAAKGG